MKISLLINMKMPTIGGIFIFISREIFILSCMTMKKVPSYVQQSMKKVPSYVQQSCIKKKQLASFLLLKTRH